MIDVDTLEDGVLNEEYPRKDLVAGGRSFPAVCGNAVEESGTRVEADIGAADGIDISLCDGDLYAIMEIASWTAWEGAISVGTSVEFGGVPFLVTHLNGSFDGEGKMSLVTVCGRRT